MILPFLLFSFCIYQTHEQQIVLTNTILCGEIPDNAQFQTNQSDKNTASFNQSDISTESLDQSKISTVSFNQSESPTIQTSQSIISTDLNTDSKNHNSQTNTRPNGTIEVSIGTFKTHYLITGLFYEVTITSSSGSGLITGLFIVTNQTRYEQGIHCPLNLSDISFPFTFLWQPDIGVKPVEIRCTLVYKNDVQFDLSTVLYPPTGCVKYFTDLYGEVSSPNFPAHYPSNLNCTYIIVVDKSYKLHLQIQKLNLEKTNNMCLDYITLNYDNNTTDRLCDYTDLEYKSYDSNTNWVVIEFYSDNSITNTGFQIDYTAQQLQDCSKTVTDSSGIISSPLFPAHYLPNTICRINIIISGSYSIFLRITNLSLEISNCNDRLYIVDNVSNISKSWCSIITNYTKDQLIFISQSNNVTIHFQTDHHHQNSGFELFYTQITMCRNRTLTDPTGSWNSINYPYSYMNNEMCRIDITLVIPSSGFVVQFDHFDTESVNDLPLRDENCTNDYLEIKSGELNHRICGNWKHRTSELTFRTTRKQVILTFVSNTNTTRSGFSLRWTSVNISSDDVCPPTLTVQNGVCFEVIYRTKSWRESEADCRSRGGHLASIINENQQKMLNSQLHKSPCISDDTSFWIGANDLQYEKDFYWTDGTKTTYSDWFKGWDEDSQDQPSDDGWSNEDCVELRRSFRLPTKGSRLTTDYKWNDRDCNARNFYVCQCYENGFMPSVQKVSTCDQTLHIPNIESTVDIQSPGFPFGYTDLLDCQIIITAPPSTHLYLYFNHFNLESSQGCEYDSLSVSSTSFDLQNDTTSKFCGNYSDDATLLNRKIPSNIVFLRFHTDNSVTFTGFNISVIAIKAVKTCETMPHILTVHNSPATYSESRKICQNENGQLWSPASITEGFSGILYFLNSVNNKVTRSLWMPSDNQTESLSCNEITWQPKVLNDQTTIPHNITMVTQQCNQTLPFICYSNCTDKVLDEMIVNLTTSSGNISVPSIDGVYENNQNITWRIKISGKRILLTVSSFDIEYQKYCLYDRLVILDFGISEQLCGNSSVPKSYLTQSNSVDVTFISDDSVVGQGFVIEWREIDVGLCENKLFNDSSGTFTSFGYGQPLSEALNCSIAFQGALDSRILLTFDELPGTTGTDCVTVDLGNDTVCMNSKNPLDVQYLSSHNEVTIFYTINRLTNQMMASYGFKGHYEIVLTGNLISREFIGVNDQRMIYSYNYPSKHPVNLDYVIILTTEVTYQLVLEITFTNLDFLNTCEGTIFSISDASFDQTPVMLFDLCDTALNKSENIFIIESVYNTLKLQVHYPDSVSSQLFHSFKISATARYDDVFINKTMWLQYGYFESCNKVKCYNGGTCVNNSIDRFYCRCRGSYTGILCQVQYCDLKPCDQGTCLLDTVNSNYKCECHHGFWGTRCTMNSILCSSNRCSGNGQCTGSSNAPVCRCNALTQGVNCSEVSTMQESVLDIGDRLLKEPIWIGIIVILLLLVLFGILYGIRRKFDKHFKCCETNIKKIREQQEKKNQEIGETTFSHPAEVYSVENSLKIFTSIPPIVITPYTPTLPTAEIGHNAATRFFASYKEAERSPISTPVATDFIQNTATFLVDEKNSGDIVGGRLSLDHLKVKPTINKNRKFSSLDPPTSSSLLVPQDSRMKRSHSTGPYLVRQETQFDDLALNQSSLSEDGSCHTNSHFYPNVIISNSKGGTDDNRGGSNEDLGIARKTMSHSLSDSQIAKLEMQVCHGPMPDIRRRNGSRDRHHREDRMRHFKEMSKSMEVYGHEYGASMSGASENCYCVKCRRATSEYEYQQRHGLLACYHSSFDDRSLRRHAYRDCGRHPGSVQSEKHRRDRRRRSSGFDMYQHLDGKSGRRDSGLESEIIRQYQRQRGSRTNSHKGSLSDIGRLHILQKFLSQDLTDFYPENESNKYLEPRNGNIHKKLSPTNSYPMCGKESRPQSRLSRSERVSISGGNDPLAPRTSLLSVTDSDSAVSIGQRPHSPSQYPDSQPSLNLQTRDSAYQSKQPSVEHSNFDLPGILEENLRLVASDNSNDDRKVTERLHQAAIKLYVLQHRTKNTNTRYAPDNEVSTICESGHWDPNGPKSTSMCTTPMIELKDLTRIPVTPVGDIDTDTECFQETLFYDANQEVEV